MHGLKEGFRYLICGHLHSRINCNQECDFTDSVLQGAT